MDMRFLFHLWNPHFKENLEISFVGSRSISFKKQIITQSFFASSCRGKSDIWAMFLSRWFVLTICKPFLYVFVVSLNVTLMCTSILLIFHVGYSMHLVIWRGLSHFFKFGDSVFMFLKSLWISFICPSHAGNPIIQKLAFQLLTFLSFRFHFILSRFSFLLLFGGIIRFDLLTNIFFK